MKDIEGAKIREDTVKRTLKRLEEMEREMKATGREKDKELGEGWIRSLQEPEKKE